MALIRKPSAPGRGQGRRHHRPGAQKGGGSLKSPPRSACRSRPELRSPLSRWLVRSTLAVVHLREAPTSSASISVTDRLSPSGVSQLRCRSRPVTITRSPLESESARCSACPRQTLTLRKLVSPSRHSPSCWMRWVTATRRLDSACSERWTLDLQRVYYRTGVRRSQEVSPWRALLQSSVKVARSWFFERAVLSLESGRCSLRSPTPT